MRPHFIFCFLCYWCFGAIKVRAQEKKGTIKGRLVFEQNWSMQYEALNLLLPQQKIITSTDSIGNFVLAEQPYGKHRIIILYQDEIIDSLSLLLDQESIDIGNILIAPAAKIKEEQAGTQDIPTIALEEDFNALEEEAGQQQNISILLNSLGNRDPFLNAASFTFGQYYFRPRGYTQQNQQILFNGIVLNDAHNGGLNSSQWTGLNEWFKNPELAYGLAANQQSFGKLNGAQAFQFNAADQVKMTKVSTSFSNRNYTNRVMFTHHSGLSKKNWAYSITTSRRWAEEGYREGTGFDAYALGLSVSKKINTRHQLQATIIHTQSERERYSAVTQEMYQLSGNNWYNPNWGWHNNEKRNAGNNSRQQPLAILQHKFQASDKTLLSSSLSFGAGTLAMQSLDWYNALDPRADYYRNMPSHYQEQDPTTAETLRNFIRQNPNALQLNWERLYEANRFNIETLYRANGDSVQGKRALYALSADVEQYQKWSIGQNIAQQLGSKIVLSGGLQATYQRSSFFRQMKDLLGADYFLNYNMFAAQQFVANPQLKQFDLEQADRAIYTGDKYRYHYRINTTKASLWGQLQGDSRKISWSATAALHYHQYQRNGLYRNGLFVNHSLGKSELQAYWLHSVKAGLTYKINGRNYVYVNALSATEDPGLQHIFIAPRLRNQVVEQGKSLRQESLEAAYALRAPKLNIKALVYATQITNNTQINRFFNDDPNFQSFVNFVLTGINTRHIGTELALEYALSKSINLQAAAAIGQAFYTNRPKVSIYSDNDTNMMPEAKTVYLKNYYLGVGPQSVYTGGISYNAKKYWNVKINWSYYDRNFISINPNRRSNEAAEMVDRQSARYTQIFGQEKLPSFYSVDLSAGKSWKLYKLHSKISYKTSLYFNIGINNLLNQRNIILSGQEQLRYDFSNNNPDKFPNRYLYAMGRNFFANISLKF